MSKKWVLVVGIGRSATSVVAGMLDKMGVFMGENLIPANMSNAQGHWEDVQFRNLNLRFLNKEIPEDYYIQELDKLLRERPQNKTNGIKAPSLCNCLDYYIDLLGAENVKIVYCKRNEQDIYRSIRKWYGWSDAEASHLIEGRKRGLESTFNKYPLEILEIEFDDVINNIKKVATDLQIFIGSSIEEKEKAIRFAKRDLIENPSVFISVLNQGQIRPELANMLLVMSRSGLKIHVEYPNAKPEQTNRNDIIKRFLKTDYTHLLMLDSDIVPKKNPLEMIKCGKPIINVAAPQWHEDDLYFVAMDKVEDGWKQLPIDRRRSLQEVDATGNASMIIQRKVLENVEPPWFEFGWDSYGRHSEGMEFRFCDKARRAGYSIWVHFDYLASHFKELDLVKVLKRIIKK